MNKFYKMSKFKSSYCWPSIKCSAYSLLFLCVALIFHNVKAESLQSITDNAKEITDRTIASATLTIGTATTTAAADVEHRAMGHNFLEDSRILKQTTALPEATTISQRTTTLEQKTTLLPAITASKSATKTLAALRRINIEIPLELQRKTLQEEQEEEEMLIKEKEDKQERVENDKRNQEEFNKQQKITLTETTLATTTSTSSLTASGNIPMASGKEEDYFSETSAPTTVVFSKTTAETTSAATTPSLLSNFATLPSLQKMPQTLETIKPQEQIIKETKIIKEHQGAEEVADKEVKQTTTTTTEKGSQQNQQILTEVTIQAETDVHKLQHGSNHRGNKANTETMPEATATTTTTMPYSINTMKEFNKNNEKIQQENGEQQITLTSTLTTNAGSKEQQEMPESTIRQHDYDDDIKPLIMTESKADAKQGQIITTAVTQHEQPAYDDDIKPLIMANNEQLLREHTIFTPQSHDMQQEWKQNLMPNEVDDDFDFNGKLKPSNIYQHNINWTPYLHPATPVTDFTGKLLQEQDGVITEIEEKFHINEFATDTTPAAAAAATTTSTAIVDATTISTGFVDRQTDMPQSNSDDDEAAKSATAAATSITSTTANFQISATSQTHLAKETTETGKMEKTFASTMHTRLSPAKTEQQKGNYQLWLGNKQTPVQFIERRVKKSFDFPMHRVASDATHMQHFDFANTKFNTNANEQAIMQQQQQQQQHQHSPTSLKQETDDLRQQQRPQPEFSTTKFYNSKELYNEMLLHKHLQQQQQNHLQQQQQQKLEEVLKEKSLLPPSLTLNSFAVLHSPKVAKLEEIHEPNEKHQKTLQIKKVTLKASSASANLMAESTIATAATTTSATTTTATPASLIAITTTATSPLTTTATTTSEESLIQKKYQKELRKAKLLIKSLPSRQNQTMNSLLASTTAASDQLSMSSTAAHAALSQNTTNAVDINLMNINRISSAAPSTTSSLSATTNSLSQSKGSSSGSSSSSSISSTTTTTSSSSSSSSTTTQPLPITTNPSKSSSSRPIVRPRILTPLQEKIDSLECEIQSMLPESHLWRGNETHELILPIMTPENCKTDKDCTAMMVSWEGEAEIQSGDILIVEINDSLLIPKEINFTTSSSHNTQVYQVTRSGHEHCDVTEGILLDITPLIVDGRKFVTLYDRDLTEGVNLLIVVSELWGSQCVRLKVTTKTENCGEGSDCSGKGICFSNSDMEEYECQCCSGFAGSHCEEIDACTPSPCTNNGICVDLSQGHEGNSYQCLCPYGYSGKNCQYELDPCNPAECMNGGSCIGNSTHFRCECTPGYTGPMCQHSLNECESSPCVHGICVDQEDGFRCFCQPGFAGELCNFEYNECESNPCQNAGECIDHIGSFECHCTKGYTGNRCHIKVDFCSNKPCPEGRHCIDHGNDYSCECPGGHNGPDCNEMQRTQCNVNPCTHGGTCWSSGDSFYCACRPGFTGTMCEDEFVVETVVSSSEFMVDDTSARNFNDKSFGSSVVMKSPIELHNAYTAAIVLALVIFFVALYLTICHCKVNQTYRKFSTRTYGFLPILGFRLRTKQTASKISRHWLSGKGLLGGGGGAGGTGGGVILAGNNTNILHRNGHLPTTNASTSTATTQHTHLNERPFQRHLAMNLENDMYYTVDFSENSQHSPLIQ